MVTLCWCKCRNLLSGRCRGFGSIVLQGPNAHGKSAGKESLPVHTLSISHFLLEVEQEQSTNHTCVDVPHEQGHDRSHSEWDQIFLFTVLVSVNGQRQMLRGERKCRKTHVLPHGSHPTSSCLQLSSFHHFPLENTPTELRLCPFPSNLRHPQVLICIN